MESIDKRNEYAHLGIEVRRSSIEGKSVFAIRGFSSGETVFEWDMSQIVHDDDISTLSDAAKAHLTRFDGVNFLMAAPAHFVNHSCEPNTRPLGPRDVAVRDIQKGEEITTDYRLQMRQGERMECHCGAPSCRGFIIGTAQ